VGGVERPGIVHRLDKDTSGVLLVAKSDAAHRGLSEQFAGRHLRKEYLALVAGVPRLKSGVIERAISRHPVHRERMTTGEGGRPARTDWEVVEAFAAKAALIRCRIHSGRTHQIRVHFKSIAHPVLGDATYGWKRDPALPEVPSGLRSSIRSRRARWNSGPRCQRILGPCSSRSGPSPETSLAQG
jgi:23S rRNA pseudouridine1911/1915/1917 synthase